MRVPSLPTRAQFNEQFKLQKSAHDLPVISQKAQDIFKELQLPKVDNELKAEVCRLEDVITRRNDKTGTHIFGAMMMIAFAAGAVALAIFGMPILAIPFGLAALYMPVMTSHCKGLTKGQKAAAILTLGFALPYINIRQAKRARDPVKFAQEQGKVLQKLQTNAKELEKNYPTMQKALEEKAKDAQVKDPATYYDVLAELTRYNAYYAQFKGQS